MSKTFSTLQISSKIEIPIITLRKISSEENLFVIQSSLKLKNDQFVTMNFTMDINCSFHFFMGIQLWNLLTEMGRISKIEDAFFITIDLRGEKRKCMIELDTKHQSQNKCTLGLPFFFLLGINFTANFCDKLVFINDICYNNGITYSPFDHL